MPHRTRRPSHRSIHASRLLLGLVLVGVCASPLTAGDAPAVTNMRAEMDAQIQASAGSLSTIIVNKIIDLTFPAAQPKEKPWRGMSRTKSAADVQLSWVSGALAQDLPTDFIVARCMQWGDGERRQLERLILDTWALKLQKSKAATLADKGDNSLVVYYDEAYRFISNGTMRAVQGEVTVQRVVSEAIRDLTGRQPWTFGQQIADAIMSYKPAGAAVGTPVTDTAFAAIATRADSGSPIEEKFLLKPNDLVVAAEAWAYKGYVYYVDHTISAEKVKELGAENIVSRLEERFGYLSGKDTDSSTIKWGSYPTRDGHIPRVTLRLKNPDGSMHIGVTLVDINTVITSETRAAADAAARKRAEEAKSKTGESGL